MNRNTLLNRHPLFQSIAAAALLAAVTAPVHVAAADSGTSSSASTAAHDQRAEARIKELHADLKITSAEEGKWKTVTDAMRENAATMRPLIEARKANAASSTAVDDLKSYGQIAQAHADGVKNFAAAFEPLYDSMSDAQKKTADALFLKPGHLIGHHHHHGKKAVDDAPATP